MTPSLALLVLSLVARERFSTVVYARGLDAIPAVLDVVEDERPLFAGPDGRHATARLLLAWSRWESRWDACAVGDNGRALGIVQVHREWFARVGVSEVATKCDAREGFRAGLRVMHLLVAQCGTVRRALAAFASGSCNPSPHVAALVERRMRAAGVE